MTSDEKFNEKILKQPNGCWEWQGSLNKTGYGKIKRSINKKGVKNYLTHRYSYYLHHGEFPTNFCCHSCDNRKCVNPEHLFNGTHQDNMDDMVSKDRWVAPSSCSKGETNGNAKLSNKDIEVIKQRIKNKETNISIAKDYNVHHSTISAIRRNKTWV